MITEIAPAKVNLYLHVGGVRPDGLHTLASLFVFTDFGDVLQVEDNQDGDICLEINGEFAPALEEFPVEDNLVYRAAHLLRGETGVTNGARITLEKALPVAAGIGGGSADAAAALRALNTLWSLNLPQSRLADLAFRLGADVPACLSTAPIFVGGAGEEILPAPELPRVYLCLINPGVETPTGPIFKAFDAANPNPQSPCQLNYSHTNQTSEFIDNLSGTRNDLQAPAIALVPEIAEPLVFLRAQPGCLLARMSGSGATVFGVFAASDEARHAAQRASNDKWWARAGTVLPR